MGRSICGTEMWNSEQCKASLRGKKGGGMTVVGHWLNAKMLCNVKPPQTPQGHTWRANDAAMWNRLRQKEQQLRSPTSGCSRVSADETMHQGQSSFHFSVPPPSLTSIHIHNTTTHTHTHRLSSITPSSQAISCPWKPSLRKCTQINSRLAQSCKLCTEMSGAIITHWWMVLLLYVPQADLNIAMLTPTRHRHHQAKQEGCRCC